MFWRIRIVITGREFPSHMGLDTISYELAAQDESQRISYLESLMQQMPMSVKDMVYIPETEEYLDYFQILIDKGISQEHAFFLADSFLSKKMWLCTYMNKREIGKYIPQYIFVQATAFDFGQEEFFCILENHEVVHTDDEFYGIPRPTGGFIDFTNTALLQEDTLVAIRELHAYLQQLGGAVIRGLFENDSPFIANTFYGFLESLELLQGIHPITDFEEQVRAEYLAYTEHEMRPYLDKVQLILDRKSI